jgi:hypothetical protein
MSEYGISNRGDLCRVSTRPPRPEPHIMPTRGDLSSSGTTDWICVAAFEASSNMVGPFIWIADIVGRSNSGQLSFSDSRRRAEFVRDYLAMSVDSFYVHYSGYTKLKCGND